MALLDRSAVRHLRPCGGPGCSGAGALRHCPRACRLRRAGRLGPPSPHLSRFRGWTSPGRWWTPRRGGRWSAVALQAQLPIAVRGELVDGQERVAQLVERQPQSPVVPLGSETRTSCRVLVVLVNQATE